MRFGSRRWKWDPRERGFSHKRFYGAADLSVLPREGLKRPRRPIENQGMTLRCTAYAGAVANGYIHNLRFHPDWQAKKIGQKQGRNIDDNGADPKAAMSSLRDDGSLILDLWPLNLANNGPEATANWSSYPDNLDKNAKDFRALAYFGVDDAFDLFDDVRYALWNAYDPKTGKGRPSLLALVLRVGQRRHHTRTRPRHRAHHLRHFPRLSRLRLRRLVRDRGCALSHRSEFRRS